MRETTQYTRRLARRAAGLNAYNSRPVFVVPGGAAPHMVGEEWHYETKAGDVIRHHPAYGKKGWSNMVYCPSTKEVVVGCDWITQALQSAP